MDVDNKADSDQLFSRYEELCRYVGWSDDDAARLPAGGRRVEGVLEVDASDSGVGIASESGGGEVLSMTTKISARTYRTCFTRATIESASLIPCREPCSRSCRRITTWCASTWYCLTGTALQSFKGCKTPGKGTLRQQSHFLHSVRNGAQGAPLRAVTQPAVAGTPPFSRY